MKNSKANDSLKREVKIVKVDTAVIDKGIEKSPENFERIKEGNQKDIDYITILVTPLIALIAVWIAYQQWIVQRYTLKLGLLERRMKVFDEVNKALYQVFKDPSFQDFNITDFYRQVGYSKFLFDKIISDYITEIADKVSDLIIKHNELKRLQEGERRNEVAESISDATMWLLNQSKVFDKKVIPFMAINRI